MHCGVENFERKLTKIIQTNIMIVACQYPYNFVIQIIENIWETKEIRKGVNLSDQQPALPQLALGERKVAVSG